MKRRCALVTGASAGLGAEFARQLAAQGRDLILVARRREPMQALAAEITAKFSVNIEIITADLSDASAVPRLFASVQERKMTVDYLVNNAGAAGPDLLRDKDWPKQQQYIELMMTSVAGMCQHFIPPMRKRGYGRVINVASVAGQLSIAGDTSYGPSKAYLIALSNGLSATLDNENVNVLALCPGFTHTDFHASEELAKMKRSTPSFIWYDADVVVREALSAVEKNKRVLTSGRLYRFLVPLLRARLSQFLIRSMGVKRDY